MPWPCSEPWGRRLRRSPPPAPRPHRLRRVDFGLAIFPTATRPARRARARSPRSAASSRSGSPSTPTSRSAARRPYPAGGELPDEYRQISTRSSALTAAAAVTERLLLGTGICLVVERDPITTAKEVATLDRISGGRFLFGIGAGWNREEMANHGTDPSAASA